MGVGAGMAIYGALVESKRLVYERKTLHLEDWPEELNGFRIVVVSDLHIRDKYSVELVKRAFEMALAEEPDMLVLPGDFVDYWKPGVDEMLREVLAPLKAMEGSAVAIAGNHDYWYGDIVRLADALAEVDVHFLRNEIWRHKGITWVGLDSAVQKMARPEEIVLGPGDRPAIALWHEPDAIAGLPRGIALQISGHSHGGQFRFPGGFTPMHSTLGKKYPSGWYPDAPTPLYVTRGVGTTGPPTRFNCPPEISVLTLNSPTNP
ncbi:metallophosphoesterase [Fimbriimonas ginsengisoli Gsoil 348]|uniref:Metallophosphoesterase n=1 Tax=Fimbriimonas ginsengisoli Gsoil 348 TaxID=661478 RepID=A0A068NNB4_FIMGI|nr:metallophosphoesterase [Fimbriimonas ginsengisoli Gsoil 348]